MQDTHAIVEKLDMLASVLAPSRHSDALANDVYEAAQDWADLGRLLLDDSARTDFQGRGRQEKDLYERLLAMLEQVPDRERSRYWPVLEAGEPLIRAALERLPSKDGYLGLAKVARSAFGYLIERGFKMSVPAPAEVRFRSETVTVVLSVDDDQESTFVFGPVWRTQVRYSLADLLFMRGDARWRQAAGCGRLSTEADVRAWFEFVGTVFEECGQEVIEGVPAVFERLGRAQAERDEAYARGMATPYPTIEAR